MRSVAVFVFVFVVALSVVLFSCCAGAQEVIEQHAVPRGLRAVTVFKRGGVLYVAGVDVSTTPYTILVYSVNGSRVVDTIACADAGYSAAGGNEAYYVCHYNLIRVPGGGTVYSFYYKPYFIMYDWYSGKVLAFINAAVGTDLYVVDVATGSAKSYLFRGFYIYGAGATEDSYYMLMYNAATGWWIARYSRDLSRVLANVSIPTPLASNTALARYSAFAANDIAIVVLFNGYTLVLDKNLNIAANISKGFERVSASRYHFYAYDSGLYVVSPTGYYYPVGVAAYTYFSMAGATTFFSDLGVAYSDAGVLYIIKPPLDVVPVTVTTTVVQPVPVVRTVISVSTTTVSTFVAYPETPVAIAIFVAIVIVAAGVYLVLRRM